MAKDDVAELPRVVPRKARLLERVPDVWIARWLAGDSLTPSDRRRLEQEKARRKAATRELRVGLLVPEEGLPGPQLTAMIKALREAGATEVHHGHVPSKLHHVAREIGVIHHQEAWPYSDERNKAVIRDSDAIIAAVRETTVQTYSTPGVWSMIGYARHRGVPVTIVMPDGTVQ